MSETMETSTDCRMCEGSLYRIDASGTFAAATRCECASPCAQCGGASVVVSFDGESSFAEPCGCTALERRIRLYNEACLPSKFANKWIEDLDDRDHTQKEAKYALLAHQDSFDRSGRGFLLWGKPGVGKTHLLCGLVGYLTLEMGVSARYVDFMQLLYDLKKAYSEGKWDSDLVFPLLEVDVLVIDELGKGKNSDWELTILDELISARYNSRKTIHCTTNYSPDGTETGVAPVVEGGLRLPTSLRERLGDRIFSRLNEMCQFFLVDGEDFRRKAQRRF